MVLFVPWMEIGGADRFNLELLAMVTERGWQATLVTTMPSRHPWRDHFEAITGDILSLPDRVSADDRPRFLRDVMSSRRPEVAVIANSELAYRFLPYLRSTSPSVTFVDYCHSDIGWWHDGGYPRFSVMFHEHLDLTLTASEHLRRWMVERGADPSRIETAHVGVDTDHFKPRPEIREQVRRELGIPESRHVVLFVGRLDDDKRPTSFVEALRDVVGEGIEVEGLIAGSGPTESRVVELLRARGMGDRVRLVGAVEPKDVARLMQAADIFVLLSRWEGIALALYEAMACGLPVIATDVGGHGELVTPQTGVLVPPEVSQAEVAAADALKLLLGNDRLRLGMGAAARQRVRESFDSRAMGERIMALLEHALVLHERNPRPFVSEEVGLAAAANAREVLRKEGRRTHHLRLQLLVVLQRVAGRYYRWSITHGLRVLIPIKDAVVRKLLPPASGR